MKLWELITLSELATLTGHSTLVFAVALYPVGHTLATGSWDKKVILWDISRFVGRTR